MGWSCTVMYNLIHLRLCVNHYPPQIYTKFIAKYMIYVSYTNKDLSRCLNAHTHSFKVKPKFLTHKNVSLL